MNPSSLEELSEVVDVMMANLVFTDVKISILESAVWLLMERAGDDKINGVRFDQWVKQETKKRLQTGLIHLENSNPEMAAKLQEIWTTRIGRMIRDFVEHFPEIQIRTLPTAAWV